MIDGGYCGVNMGFFSPELRGKELDDDIVINNNILLSIIDGYKAKIAAPKTKLGMTGIRITAYGN